jgi:O-acetyl-ADP-ribose deacetylase (regulator of RNase III)
MAKTIEEVKSDLLSDPTVSVIIHQVKTTNKFDGGLAAQIRVKFPAAWKADILAAERKENKLGMFSYAQVSPTKWIINVYSESTHHSQMNYTDYNALRRGLTEAKKYIMANLRSPVVGMGRIGTKAGGDWNVARKIVEEVFTDYDGKVKICEAPGA